MSSALETKQKLLAKTGRCEKGACVLECFGVRSQRRQVSCEWAASGVQAVTWETPRRHLSPVGDRLQPWTETLQSLRVWETVQHVPLKATQGRTAAGDMLIGGC